MTDPVFPGRLALQQRVLPDYRAPFFDLLASACQGGLSVFAGQPGPGEAIQTAAELQTARLVPARNRHFGPVTSPFYLCWQSGLLAWLQAEQPQALILEANPRYLSSRRALTWMHARQSPVVGWGLGAPPARGWKDALRSMGRAAFLLRFDALIAYSRRGAEEYRALGFPGERIFVAHNAAARRPASPPPGRGDSFNTRPRVLFVGRLQMRKRIDLLLRACAALPDALQPDLDIIGEGPARAGFQALAMQVYPRAAFHGARHGAELADFFAAADLFVLPGTGGLAVQEAMAHALPVIAAEGDGTQDDLVRPANGWRVPPGDLPALTASLKEALTGPARLRQMGAEAFRIVNEEINLEQMVAVFLQALAAVAG